MENFESADVEITFEDALNYSIKKWEDVKSNISQYDDVRLLSSYPCERHFYNGCAICAYARHTAYSEFGNVLFKIKICDYCPLKAWWSKDCDHVFNESFYNTWKTGSEDYRFIVCSIILGALHGMKDSSYSFERNSNMERVL